MELRRFKYVFLVAAILLILPSAWMSWNGSIDFDYFGGAFNLSATLGIIAATSYLIEKGTVRPNKTLSKATFFIYASHNGLPFLTTVSFVFKFATLKSSAWSVMLFGYLVIPVITAFACVAFYLVLKKICPPVAKILSGNR